MEKFPVMKLLLAATVSFAGAKFAAFVPSTTTPSNFCSCLSMTQSSGPKSEASSRRRRSSSALGRRRPSSTNTGRRRTPSSSAGTYAVATKRAPHQFDHTKEEARPFIDGKTEIAEQLPNEDAMPFDIPEDNDKGYDGEVIAHDHIQTTSLDCLFPGLDFSKLFAASTKFRTALRASMREDIFDTTPAYASMSEKARKMLLLPDSSLQGSWKCKGGRWERNDKAKNDPVRMTAMTKVLTKYLGDAAPSGDEFMDKIGSLCGSQPSTHWIDIVGVQDRRIPHSWHQDTGQSPNNDTFTVLLAFPPEDYYDSVGVFSHLVKLKKERHAADDHPPNEPVVFPTLKVPDQNIIRPRFAEGREIIFYRDIDVVHSSPDVAYRASVMRFM